MIFLQLLFIYVSLLSSIGLADEEEGLFPILPSGYLFEDRYGAVRISGSNGVFLGQADEDGSFIALGGRGPGSAFGRINPDGTVMIFYNPADDGN